MVLLSVILTCTALGSLRELAPTVRPATAAEAPNPEHLEGTVIAEPGASVPLAAGLQTLAVRLLLLGLLAGAGAALCTWAVLSRRRRTTATR